jgi:hypothetical protein
MKLKTTNALLSFFLLLMGTDKLAAQQNLYSQVSIATPNAAALGKYADIPVNYHTGIPQINLPIYTIQDGPIQVPVGLSYHASGLKVAEPASWVGAGWSLQAGGAISRTVQGAPDEHYTSNANAEQAKGYLSDKGYPNYLWHKNVNDPNDFEYLLKDFQNGYADGEPDLFFFNFAGYSGKFYFGDDKVPVVMPEQDIKIEYSYTPGLRKSIESFVLTTPDGNRYYFGYTPSTTDVDPVERSLAYSASSGYNNDGRSISAWYLNKIVAANGNHQVLLSYEAEKYSYFNVASGPLKYDNPSSGSTPFGSSTIGGNGSTLNKVVVDGVRLKQISFADGIMELVPGTLRTDLAGALLSLADDPNAQAKTLAEVRISNTTGSCKKFQLSYGYFENLDYKGTVIEGAYINSDRRRLKLLQVQEAACDNSITMPPYNFDYHTEPVPRTLSFSQDHWGFYNGADNNTLIPTYTENQFDEVPGADRDSKWPAMRGGTLYKITYPTGGYAEYEYEPNRAWVSYNRYNRVYAFSTAVGYDNNNSSTTYQPFSGNPYQIKLSNATCTWPATSCLASIQIFNAANAMVCSLSAEGGQQKTAYTTLAAGTYKIVMYKTAAGQGSLASGTFTQLVPVLYESNEMVGGLRIKSITQTEQAQPGTVMKTNYSYEVNSRTTGILYSRPVYVQVIKNSGPRYIGTSLWQTGSMWRKDSEEPINGEEPYFSMGVRKAYKSPAPLLPMSTTQGNHIGYSEVKVSKAGNGYSIYRFYGSNIWDNDYSDVAVRKIDRISMYPAAAEFPAAPLQYDYKRGELKYEGHFTETGKLLKDATYIPVYQVQPVTTPGIRVYAEYRVPQNGDGTWVAAKTDFELQTEKKISQTVIENVLDQVSNDYLQTTKTTLWQSPNHNQPTTISTINSMEQPIATKIKYTPDFLIPACETIDNCWSSYQAELAAALSNYNTAYLACTDDNCRKLAKANYNGHRMIARRNYSQCRMDRLALKSTCLQNAKAAAGTELKPILALQDAFRILPVEQTSWKNNLLTGASFNRFEYDIGSTTHVNLNKVQQLRLTAPTASFTPATNTATTLTKDSRYTDAETYRFSYGVLSEAEKPGKVITSYLWDYGNTKPVAAATNASVADIAFTSFETSNGNGFIYNEAATTANAAAPTGKRVFALSSTNTISRVADAAKVYTVSCWAQASITVNGAAPLRTGRSTGGFTYYEWQVSNATQVTLAGNTLVDEVRLYLKNAQMTTYTYEPLIGVTSQSDINGNILYYEYDSLGRLKYIRDMDKNVVKVMEYQYKVGIGN